MFGGIGPNTKSGTISCMVGGPPLVQPVIVPRYTDTRGLLYFKSTFISQRDWKWSTEKAHQLRPITTAIAREGSIIIMGVIAAVLGTEDAIKRIAEG